MTAARRLAAILAVDVVGYSRQMGEDEARTARAIAIATSTVTIFNDRFTSTPAVRRGTHGGHFAGGVPQSTISTPSSKGPLSPLLRRKW